MVGETPGFEPRFFSNYFKLSPFSSGMNGRFALLLVLLLMLSAIPIEAVSMRVGETTTQVVGGKQVTLYFQGLNTERERGAIFLQVNGKTYIINNGSDERIGGLTVSVGRVIIDDDFKGGSAYITLRSDASCSDGIKNQDEQRIDCGGASCAPCYSLCTDPNGCGAISLPPSQYLGSRCLNGRKDGDETDVDCGGPCQKCGTGKACYNSGDCVSSTCTYFKCAPDIIHGTCFDGLQNQGETGTDCGGPCQMSCVTVRNASSICGLGCFFLNNECVCPRVQQKPTAPTVASPPVSGTPPVTAPEPPSFTELLEMKASEYVVSNNLTVESVVFFRDTNQLRIIGTRAAKLFGVFPIRMRIDSLVDAQTGNVINQSKPRWAVFAQ